MKPTWRRRGGVLIYVSIGLPAMIAFCSLAVDWGRLQLAKNQLQVAADAAARYGLAGVSYSVPTAQSRALVAAADNACDGTPVVLDATLDVEFGDWDDSARSFTVLSGSAQSSATALRVTAQRTSARGNATPLVFGQILGARTCDARAVAIAKFSPAKYAVVGLDYVKMSGNSTSSYWSASGSAGKSKLGNVASNGDITLSGSSYINGNVRPGVGKQVYGATGRVSGSIKPLTTPLSFPNGDAGNYAYCNDNGNLPPGATSSTSLSVGSNKAFTAPGGNYYFNNVTIAGSLTFTGPATIYCYGSFSMSGSAYTNGNKPGNLTIVMCPGTSGAPPGSLSVGSSTALYASIYAPQSALSFSGSGDLYGSVLGKSIDMTGTSEIHYDMSLEADGGPITLVK